MSLQIDLTRDGACTLVHAEVASTGETAAAPLAVDVDGVTCMQHSSVRMQMLSMAPCFSKQLCVAMCERALLQDQLVQSRQLSAPDTLQNRCDAHCMIASKWYLAGLAEHCRRIAWILCTGNDCPPSKVLSKIFLHKRIAHEHTLWWRH